METNWNWRIYYHFIEVPLEQFHNSSKLELIFFKWSNGDDFSLRFYEFLCIARSFKSGYSLQQDLCMKFSHVGFLIVTKRRQFKWNYARKTLSEDVKLSQFKMSYDDCIVLLNSNQLLLFYWYLSSVKFLKNTGIQDEVWTRHD